MSVHNMGRVFELAVYISLWRLLCIVGFVADVRFTLYRFVYRLLVLRFNGFSRLGKYV
ncbi:hypothetical protein [Anaplasma phagocytophilum]|uniref:hypothetical protein n=1 Tax=Anaplasma phagocytophilum TaxID=948 RepID=UPI00201A7CA1